MQQHEFKVKKVINRLKECKNRKEYYKTGLSTMVKYYKIQHIGNEILSKIDQQNHEIFINNFNKAVKNCKSITELRTKYPQYVWYINNNIETVKKNFIRQKYSTPQLICKNILEQLFQLKCEYNTRKVLKSRRELDIYFPSLKIACEYNSFFWHNKPYIKISDKEKDNECKNRGIYLMRINEEQLNNHNNFDSAVRDIKIQIKNKLKDIIKFCNISFVDADIQNIEVKYENIMNNCFNIQLINDYKKECKTYAEFRKKYNSIYQQLLKNKQLNLLDDLKNRDHRHMSKSDYILYITNSCSNYSDFLKHKSYSYAYARGYSKEIKSMFFTTPR